MKNIYSIILFNVLFAFFFSGAIGQENPHKAPLYWSVYEHHIVKEQAGIQDNYIPESEFLENINWVDENLKDLGYDMICVDGWGDVNQLSENGYRTSHSEKWENDFAWWSAHLQERGMTLGMYGNPLWVHVDENDQETMIVGTDIPVSSLKEPSENAAFPWVQVDRPGAEEYVKGYVQYYADMGIKYFRVDFLSWYESGKDRYMEDPVGPTDRPHEHYVTALRWMREAADENGMFLSLVMPNLFNEAEVELEYGHMMRINEDTGEGAWHKWSEKDRGLKRVGWSVYANPADGLTYWSYVAGRGKMILDPDFIRINTFANDDEKKSVISLSLMAGAPITISDQYHSIGTDLWLYQNKELLALNYDGFVGKPLTNDPKKAESQIWKGQMSNGDWIIGLFNRENETVTRAIDFNTELGIVGNAQIRDLWTHKNLSPASSFSAEIPPHGVIILKIIPEGETMGGIEPIFVESLVTGTETFDAAEMKGIATVRVKDGSGNPVEGARITARFSASFEETVTGITNADGLAILKTNATATGTLKVNACVTDVSHSAYVYAADQNLITCVGDKFFVGGTINDWTLKPMVYENGWWKCDSVFIPEGNHELKFANTDNWTGDDWGNATGLSGVAVLSTGGDPNISFNISDAGLFDIAFNDITLEYTIVESEITKTQDEMYVGGTFSDWSLLPMSFDEANKVWMAENVAIEPGNYELKFANTNNFSGDDWGNASGLSGIAKLTTGGDPNISFQIAKSSDYTISFNDISLEYSIQNQILTSVTDNGTNSQKRNIRVFPNPAASSVFISTGSVKGRVYIINTIGVTVFSQIIGGTESTLNLSTLKNGLYILKLRNENEDIYVQKLLISK